MRAGKQRAAVRDEGGGAEVEAARRERVPGRGRRRSGWAAVLVVGIAVLLIGQATEAQAATGGINEVKSFATKLTAYVTAIAASVAILFMAINGLRWTMSSGNPMRQAEACNSLVAAAIGLAIALSAGVIVNLVIAALK